MDYGNAALSHRFLDFTIWKSNAIDAIGGLID
jgi:hypothetical protein